MRIKNLIRLAENFCGSRGFQNYYSKKGSDVLKNGDRSCAIFVSVILVMTRAIDGVSYTVRGLTKRIDNSQLFFTIQEPPLSILQTGDIVVWDSLDRSSRKHIGVYVGEGTAISNRSSSGAPGRHPVIYTGFDKDHVAAEAKILFVYRLKNP